jgi:cytolysin-activating lysine-acyltransferase
MEVTILNTKAQIKSGTFMVRLKPEDWTSGPVNWLLDVIAPDAKVTGQVIANFRQVVKEGDLRIHPLVAGLVDEGMRGKMMDARNAADQAT